MIEVLHQQKTEDFLKTCGGFLEQSPAEHNVILSMCDAARKSGDAMGMRYTSLLDEEGLVVASAQMPSRNIVLSRARENDIRALAENLAAQNAAFPGIVGPSDVAATFAEAWSQLTGRKSVEYMDQIIYSLSKVVMPAPIDGEFRAARLDEKPTFARWMAAFAKDTLPKAEHLDEKSADAKAEELIRDGRLYAWVVGGKPVAQAAVTGTDKVARINAVYTPPEARGMGYASAVVAHLSRKMLDEGKTLCCLYADARNPVSNSIYRKIGYEFVGRSSLYVLD